MLPALLSDLSTWTWHFLRDAPFRPREETITETLLVEFVRRGNASVWVHKSTLGEEVALGIDWALALRTQAGWLLALVQAKNVEGQAIGRYLELRKPTAKKQAENLLHAAELAEALPLYVFFNGEVPPFGSCGTAVTFGNCLRGDLRRHARDEPSAGLPWDADTTPAGVSLAHAQDVLEHVIPPPAANQHAARVNQLAMPWECLLCPAWQQGAAPTPPAPPGGGPSGTGRIGDAARRLGAVTTTPRHSNNVRRRDSPAWLHPEMPRWATLVQEMRDPSEDDDAPISRFYVVVDVTEVE